MEVFFLPCIYLETPSDILLKRSYISESFCKYVSRSNMLLLTHLAASLFSPRNDESPRFWQRSGERWGIKAVRKLLPTAGVWSTRCVEQWEEPKRKAVGGPVLCKYRVMCVKTWTVFKELRRPKKRRLLLQGNIHWDRIAPWPIMVIFLATYSRIFSLFQWPHTYFHRTPSFQLPRKIPAG